MRRPSPGAMARAAAWMPPQPTVGSHRERDDGYVNVVVPLSERWRVIVCKDGLQWIVQTRANAGQHGTYWRSQHYCVTREALIRLCAATQPRPDPSVMAVLAALPEHMGMKVPDDPSERERPGAGSTGAASRGHADDDTANRQDAQSAPDVAA